MSWVKLDDGFFSNRKVRSVSATAALFDIASFCFCAQSENDGHVLTGDVQMIAAMVRVRSPAKYVKELVQVGLWDVEPGGYNVHDFLEYNPSHAELIEKRRVANERSEMRADASLMGRIRARDNSACRYCGRQVNWKDRRGELGGTYDHVIPMSKGGPSTYGNVVVACRACNSKKRDKTLEEAGMVLQDIGNLPVNIPITIQSSPPVPSGSPLSFSASGSGARVATGGPIKPDTAYSLVWAIKTAVEAAQPKNGMWAPDTFAQENASRLLVGLGDAAKAMPELERKIGLFAADPEMQPWTVKKFCDQYNGIGHDKPGRAAQPRAVHHPRLGGR